MAEAVAADPVVTVVTAVHNGEDLIGGAISSVLRQDMAKLELIVVDDGSSDRTSQVVQDWANHDSRVRLITLPYASGSPARPRNVAIEATSAEFIALLDHDDEWEPDKLTKQLDRLRSTSADICYSRCTMEDVEAGVSTDYHRRWMPTVDKLPEGRIVEELLEADVVPCSTVIFRRDLIHRIGLFDEGLPALEDYDLWLRAAIHGASFCAVEDSTAVYRWSRDNLSHAAEGRRAELSLRMWNGLSMARPHDRRVREKALDARAQLARDLVTKAIRSRMGLRERARLVWRALWVKPPVNVYTAGLGWLLGRPLALLRTSMPRGASPDLVRARQLGSKVLHSLAPLAVALRVPPKWSRYHLIRSTGIVDHATRATGCCVDIVARPHRERVALPRNLRDQQDLPESPGRWHRSFRDVPTRVRQSPSIVHIADGRVVSATGPWGSEHCALLGPDNERLTMHGIRWLAGHRAALNRSARSDHANHVVWPWESWYQNHFHWTVRHLSKLVMLRDQALTDNLILPRFPQFDSVHIASAQHLGIDLHALPRMSAEILCTRRLTLVDLPDLHPAVVDSLRGGFGDLIEPPQGRRLYVRRTQPGRRQIVNETEVWNLLKGRGFEQVHFEQLTFDAQVRTCSQAAIILGLHGAGLANAVFAHPGSQLIEITDPRYPNPEYYELAAVAGLGYWMIEGAPKHAPHEWLFGDVTVDVGELDQVLAEAIPS